MISFLFVSAEILILDSVLPQLFVNENWDYYMSYLGVILLITIVLLKYSKTSKITITIFSIFGSICWFGILNVEDLLLFPKIVTSTFILLIIYKTHKNFYYYICK